MNKLFVIGLLGCLLAIPATAQTDQQPSGRIPCPRGFGGAYMGNRNNIVRTADKMPEETTAFGPGPQQEVRTFRASKSGTSANFTFLWCSRRPRARKESQCG